MRTMRTNAMGRRALHVCWLLLVSASGLAETEQSTSSEVGRWYFMPYAGSLRVDDDRRVESSDELAGIAIGRHLSERWSLELNANGASLAGDANPALDLYGVSLDALRVFRRDEAIAPFVTFGLGAVRSSPDVGASDTDPLAQVGAGVHWRLGSNRRDSGMFSLRPEIKARWSDASAGSMLDYTAMLGFQFSFGARRAPVSGAPEAARSSAAEPVPQVASQRADAIEDAAPSTRPPAALVTLPGVWFAFDDAELSAEAHTVLDRLAGALRTHPRLRIELQGHTDSLGSEAHNLRLSQRRADAAREYLLAQGVPADQVTAHGFGESRPIADNATEAGRTRNRRVDVVARENPEGVEIREEPR